jgi:nucleotide-binding universal stress UspA family protein
MPTILAALDASETLEPTARAARSLAVLFDAEVVGLHVLEEDSPEPATLARRAGIAVSTRPNDDVVASLLAAMEDPDVVLAVVGSRDLPENSAPVGHVARLLATQLTTPLLVVPPGSALGSRGELVRALVPLNGDPPATDELHDLIARLTHHDVEVVVTHVFDPRHPPRFIDEPQHGYEAWRDEFWARHEPRADRVELRRGAAWDQVLTCAHDVAAELIVLCWAQRLAPGRAEVVREVLANPTIPTLLLPRTGEPPVR